MLLLEASLAAHVALILAGVATVDLIALLVAFQFLDAFGGKRAADRKRALSVAVPPLAVILAVTLVVRLISILSRR